MQSLLRGIGSRRVSHFGCPDPPQQETPLVLPWHQNVSRNDQIEQSWAGFTSYKPLKNNDVDRIGLKDTSLTS